MVEKKSKKSQKNIFEHLIGQVGLTQFSPERIGSNVTN